MLNKRCLSGQNKCATVMWPPHNDKYLQKIKETFSRGTHFLQNMGKQMFPIINN